MNDETAHAEKLFNAAARKVERQIEAVRAGDDAIEPAVRTAIDRLYDRAFKPEIRGDEPARDRCYEKINALRASFRDAAEIGATKRRDDRDNEIARLNKQKREENLSLTTYEREIRVKREKFLIKTQTGAEERVGYVLGLWATHKESGRGVYCWTFTHRPTGVQVSAGWHETKSEALARLDELHRENLPAWQMDLLSKLETISGA